MTWLQSILFGLVAGITEFLPISSNAHQNVLRYMFGQAQDDPVRGLFIHAAMLLSLYTVMRNLFDQVRREQRLKRDRRRNQATFRTITDLKLVKNAAFPMIVGMLVLFFAANQDLAMPWICLLLVMNGLILFITERAIRGNKDAQKMSALDSWLVGICGAFSIFPGISRIGIGMSLFVLRGADRNKALNWTLLLSVPALVAVLGIDMLSIFSGSGVPFFPNLVGYLLSGIFAYLGGCIGLYIIRLVTERSGYLAFAYYSWGAALFSFIIFLMVA
jgi:undecaprenyl-diphosphatase